MPLGCREIHTISRPWAFFEYPAFGRCPFSLLRFPRLCAWSRLSWAPFWLLLYSWFAFIFRPLFFWYNTSVLPPSTRILSEGSVASGAIWSAAPTLLGLSFTACASNPSSMWSKSLSLLSAYFGNPPEPVSPNCTLPCHLPLQCFAACLSECSQGWRFVPAFCKLGKPNTIGFTESAAQNYPSAYFRKNTGTIHCTYLTGLLSKPCNLGQINLPHFASLILIFLVRPRRGTAQFTLDGPF